ncbi:MAG TPA: cupin domain-containing protein [Stellaceae bacterium]|nr:cupin domain-containing protein [Stellaceae bacterium]
MKVKGQKTLETDARTNQAASPVPFDIDSHDDYVRLREEFARMPKIPTLVHVDEAPVAKGSNRTYNWLLTSEQSGGSIALHVLTVEPGFTASDHHHSNEEEFFFVLDGEIEITVGNKTTIGGPGTFAYVPPFATHAFKPHGGKPCRILHWNSPGGHERLGEGLQRLARKGPSTRDEGRKVREDHEYFFHEYDE